jgi:hypothetical protein
MRFNSVFDLLWVGVSLWCLSGLLAFASCWGSAPTAAGDFGAGSGVLRVLSKAVSGSTPLSNPMDALLSSAHGLTALRDAGVLSTGGADDATRLALQLAQEILAASRQAVGTAAAGGGAGQPSPSPSTNPKTALRLKRLGKFAKSASGAAEGVEGGQYGPPPKDMHYTHQKCYIQGDESEVSGRGSGGGRGLCTP